LDETRLDTGLGSTWQVEGGLRLSAVIGKRKEVDDVEEKLLGGGLKMNIANNDGVVAPKEAMI